jgi:hypothetical protein
MVILRDLEVRYRYSFAGPGAKMAPCRFEDGTESRPSRRLVLAPGRGVCEDDDDVPAGLWGGAVFGSGTQGLHKRTRSPPDILCVSKYPAPKLSTRRV